MGGRGGGNTHENAEDTAARGGLTKNAHMAGGTSKLEPDQEGKKYILLQLGM